MRTVEVETFLKPMGAGISRPVLVIGDDFNEYILKNQKVNENGNLVDYNCMFLNEVFAYQIAVYLGVPIPETVIAFVEGDFAENDPSIRFAYRFEKGKYFATEKLKYVENNIEENYRELISMGKPYRKKTWKDFFKQITNKEDITKILAFDILIGNFDRYNNEGNILVDKTNQRKIYAIDHGHAFFGPIWNNSKVNCLNLKNVTSNYIDQYSNAICSCIPGSMYNALEENIHLEDLDYNPFDEIVQKILKIDESMIIKWLDSIPDEWYIDKNVQSSYYINFILKQKEAMKNIIQRLAEKNAFTNYRGGILKWSNQKEKYHTV